MAAGRSQVPSGPDDHALLRAHVLGDPDAFGVLFARHRDRLWAVALRTLGDREDAADALQDALISALRGAHGYRGDAAVTTWLHRIVVNACLDRIRRSQARPTVPLDDDERTRHEPLDDPAGERDTALDVRQALTRITPDQRIALVLVDVQGHSVAAAAEILGVAEGTVKSRCARGRAQLVVLLAHLRTGSDRPAGNPGAARSVPSVQAAESDRPNRGRPNRGRPDRDRPSGEGAR
jgi:RNA polymerase sigma-70 factor (ECF subfamily)